MEVGKPRALPPPVPLELDLLGTIELQATAPAPAESWDFDLDDQGRLGRMVRLADGGTRFELRDGAGALVAAVALPIRDTPESTTPAAFCVQGGRWLVHTATYGEQGRAKAWWLDLPAGTLTPIERFVCSPIDKGAGTGDGGFVVLTSRSVPYGIETTLSSFDAQGRLRWCVTEAYGDSEDGLFSPEDVCVSPRGEIGVLDNVRDDIQRFDLDGRLTGVIHLADALGRKPNYPARLGVDAQGDWVVQDFGGSPSGLRISRDGRLLSSFTPHFADGRVVAMRGGLQGAPDGRVWTSDGFAGLRLDANGVVDLVAGMAPEAGALSEVEDCFLDARGRAALADHRTHAIHVFDATGARVAVCVPAPDDLAENAEVAGIALADDGQVHAWLGLFSFFGQLGVVFGPDGTRLGRDDVSGPSFFQPGKSSRWVTTLLDLRLLGSDGEVVRTISRSPDHRWLGTVRAAAVAPGGELAVIARDRLHVFAADGAPGTTFELPGDARHANLAFDGTHVLLAWLGQLWEVDVTSGRLRHAVLPDVTPDAATRPAWGADGAELRILDEKARRVLRYAIRP
jgi:sugar lactone lactonase YvrE